MELPSMSLNIISMIDKKYTKISECLDVIQIKNICNLYKNKHISNHSITLSEIKLSTPEFTRAKFKKVKSADDILKTEDFQKKYAFFIRMVYACLKIGVEIFDDDDTLITLKNNYQLIKSIELKKKKLIYQHIELLKTYYKNPSELFSKEYRNYFDKHITKIDILEKIYKLILKLIDTDIFCKTDNLFSLILPYFYRYNEYIEEYNS